MSAEQIELNRFDVEKLPTLPMVPMIDISDPSVMKKFAWVPGVFDEVNLPEISEGGALWKFLHCDDPEQLGALREAAIESGEYEEVVVSWMETGMKVTGYAGENPVVFLAEVGQGEVVGFISAVEVPTNEGIVGDVLADAEHPWWEVLVEADIITREQVKVNLEAVRDQLAAATVLEPLHAQVRSENRREGVGGRLVAQLFDAYPYDDLILMGSSMHGKLLGMADGMDRQVRLNPLGYPESDVQTRITDAALLAHLVDQAIGNAIRFWDSDSSEFQEPFEGFAELFIEGASPEIENLKPEMVAAGIWPFAAGQEQDTSENAEIIKGLEVVGRHYEAELLDGVTSKSNRYQIPWVLS